MVDHTDLYIVRVKVSQPSHKTRVTERIRLYFYCRQDLQDKQDYFCVSAFRMKALKHNPSGGSFSYHPVGIPEFLRNKTDNPLFDTIIAGFRRRR
jgi:hypothetical protein